MKKILSFFVIFQIFSLSAYAIEDTKKISLKEAINIAATNNIDLQAEKINIDIAKNEIKKANRLQNPTIDSFYFYGTSGRGEPRQWGLSQDIEIGKRYARKNIAKSQHKLVEKNYEYILFDLKMDVREAYINLVATKSILDTLKQQKDLQEELLKIAEIRFKQNAENNIDLIQAKIALNQLLTQINTAKVNVDIARTNFNKIINSPTNINYDTKDTIFIEDNNYEEMFTPDPNTAFPDFNCFSEKILDKRGDMLIVKQEIDLAEKKLILTLHQRVPDIQLSSGYSYVPSQYSTTGSFTSGAYLGAKLVNIPLFYNFSPDIENAKLKLEQAELKYISVKNKAIKDIESSYSRFLTARKNLMSFEQNIIKNSQELIDFSKKKYETGKSDITSIIVMKQNYKSIIIGYTQALADYYNSWTNFLREINDENFNIEETL